MRNEQRIEQLESELAEVERQLRRTRVELDEIGVSKVPENVKAGTFLNMLISFLCFITGGAVALAGSCIEGVILKLLIIITGIIIIGVGISHNVNKVSVPDIMIRYNTLEKRVQELRKDIQEYKEDEVGDSNV